MSLGLRPAPSSVLAVLVHLLQEVQYDHAYAVLGRRTPWPTRTPIAAGIRNHRIMEDHAGVWGSQQSCLAISHGDTFY